MSTVTVALRLPSGLIIEHEGKKHLLNGWNHGANAQTPNNEGFGFTDGVPADLWAGWLAAASEGKLQLVTNDLVFANADPSAARAQARERERNVSSGLEGVDPEGTEQGGVKLEPTDETRKTLNENKSKRN